MSEKLTKVAYNYIDDLLEKLRQTLGVLSTKKPFDAKTYNNIETRYRQLQKKRFAPSAESAAEASLANVALNQARTNFTPDIEKNVEDTSRMSPFHQWEQGIGATPEKPRGFQAISKLPNNEQGQPEWVSLPNLKFLGLQAARPAQSAQYIKTQMGDALILNPKGDDPKQPEYDTYIRGTQEAWNKFTRLAPYIFDNVSKLPTAKSLGLKSEKDYNPAYTAEDSGAASTFPLGVKIINQGTQDHWEIGQEKNDRAYKPGIRLTFEPQDDNFYSVSGLIVNELQLQSTRTNRAGRTIDIYDPDAKKLLALSQKLQQAPYKYPVKPLNDAITALTGQAIGDVQKKISDKIKSAPLSDKVVKSRLEANIYQPPVDRQTFGDQVQQLYPGAFNPQFVGDRQAKAQTDGMYFILGRGTSVLADEPGAGKTAQSIVGADFATRIQDQEAAAQASAQGQPPPPQKKILVFTPLALVEEHWTSTGGKQSKPEMYAGQQPNATVIIRSLDDFNNVGDQTRWVVIAYTTLSGSDDGFKIAQKIAADSKAGVYGSVILDEIQNIKKLDSEQGTALRTAISAGGIKHRIGLTGTPADNDPADLYAQLRITRHPILYDTAGVVQQTEKGFAEQFLGGAAYADKETHDKNGNSRTITRIDSIFNWARRANKELLIQLFSTTYIRRTKEDMKPELPKKDRNAPQAITGQEQHWGERLAAISQEQKVKQEQIFQETGKRQPMNPWQPLEKEMALAKIPYTVKSAIAHLQNPQNKLFVVTKYPDVAESIAQQINSTLGQGIAAEVSGDVEKSMKTIVPNTFKKNNGMLKGAKVPLRCVVYTMKMGAVGLNFSVANKFIANDIDWNPSTNLQAEDRVHRIDSPHASSIEYIYFAGTYDQQMFTRVRQKEAVNKEINGILRAASLHPDKVHEIAGKFIMSLVGSLLFDIHMTPMEEQYVQKKVATLKTSLGVGEELPVAEIAASTGWYRRCKAASFAYRHLW